jgi:hypothetical protein
MLVRSQNHSRESTGDWRDTGGTPAGHRRDTGGTVAGQWRDSGGTVAGHFFVDFGRFCGFSSFRTGISLFERIVHLLAETLKIKEYVLRHALDRCALHIRS